MNNTQVSLFSRPKESGEVMDKQARDGAEVVLLDSLTLARHLKAENCPGVSFPVIHMIVRTARKGHVPAPKEMGIPGIHLFTKEQVAEAVKAAVLKERDRLWELLDGYYNPLTRNSYGEYDDFYKSFYPTEGGVSE